MYSEIRGTIIMENKPIVRFYFRILLLMTRSLPSFTLTHTDTHRFWSLVSFNFSVFLKDKL